MPKITPRRIKRFIKINYYKLLSLFLNPKGLGLNPYENSVIKRKLTKLVPWSHNSAVYLIITGDVTGVGYARWLWRRARVRGLECRVKESNGKVKAVIIGNPEAIERVILSAWKGTHRCTVVNIKEYWFNKAIKSGASDSQVEKKHVSWSQGTADRIINTLKQISAITQKPNEYTESGKLVGTDELIRAASEEKLCYVRCGRKEVLFISPQKKIGLQRSQSTRVSSIVHSLTDHKQLTKDFLQKHGLPVPYGKVFTNFDDAKAFFQKLNKPLVVKPAAGLNGSGVTVDVRSIDALEAAWQYAKRYHKKVILEELVQGVDIRVVVIGGHAKAALLRVPANVIGDGVHSVRELVRQKNDLRLGNPRLKKNLIIPDAYSDSYLERQGLSWDSVPSPGQVVFLHLKANICKGADSISITDFIHPDLMNLAEEAAQVFGVNDYWGIDLLAERIDLPRHEQNCYIIELNSTANIENVIYPLYGPSFDSAKQLIHHLFFADLKKPYQQLTVEVMVTGLLGPLFAQWVESYAREHGITGSVQLGDKRAHMLIQGKADAVNSFLNALWSWEQRDTEEYFEVVDGFGIKYTSKLSTEDFCVIPEPLPLTTAKAHTPSNFVFDLPVANYQHTVYKKEEDLFIPVFQQRGFKAETMDDGLIQITKDSLSGVTGIYHSTLFCDKVCDKLYPAKKLLALHGLPVLRGIRLTTLRVRKAVDYFISLGQTCTATSMHPVQREVHIINSEQDLKMAWYRAKNRGTKYMLLEEYIPGYTVCLAVVANKAETALILEPAYVLGDGKSSIEELIKNKNRLRANNPWYSSRLIKVNKTLDKILRLQNKEITDVPAKGEKVFVESDMAFEWGGETIECNDIIHKDFYEKAVQAVEAMPGLEFAEVYLRIPCPELAPERQTWAIIRIDTKPSVAKYHFPWKGKPYNLAGKVVDNLCLTDRTRWVKGGQTDGKN